MNVPLEKMQLTIQQMREFQIVHNELRKDFLNIYDITVSSELDLENFTPLIRACLKELFSLIEADLFLYNQWNPYHKYDDKDKLFIKFKKTYKMHSESFPNENRRQTNYSFQSKSFELLKKLSHKRNEVTHPKGRVSIRLNSSDLTEINTLYVCYIDFIKTMFVDVMVTVK